MTDQPTEAKFEAEIEVTEGEVRKALIRASFPPRLAARSAQRLYRQSLGIPPESEQATIARAEAKRARKAARA